MYRVLSVLRQHIAPVLVGFGLAATVSAASVGGEAGSETPVATIFLWIAIILLLAKFSSFVAAFGQPVVLGELLMGVALGNLALVGIGGFEHIAENVIIEFLAELGVVILLFQIGLETNVREMRQVGGRAAAVAVVGVATPFLLGTYVIAPWLFPTAGWAAHLFLGATLTATSVGITGRVFKDLGKLKTPEAQIVLGAAVFDDILGLIILAIVSAVVTVGAVSVAEVGFIMGKAVLFLVGAVVVGQLAAAQSSKLFSRISTGVGMKFTLAISFGLVFAYLAHLLGLAPIVGAFAAGLILDPVHFRYFKDPKVVRDVRAVVADADPALRERILGAIEPHARRHVDDIVEPIGFFLVPIFFVVTGMNVNLVSFANPRLLVVALVVTITAFAGKLVAGVVAGPVRKWVVGWGMVPRGEVGLIFATIGRGLGVVSDDVYAVIVIMVIVTTLLTPPILSAVLRRSAAADVATPI